MKVNKFNLMLYIKNGNLNWLLYILASLVIVVPAFIASITDNPFSLLFSKVFISISFILFIIGKLITLFKRKKECKNIYLDIGVVLGILTAFISFVLK